MRLFLTLILCIPILDYSTDGRLLHREVGCDVCAFMVTDSASIHGGRGVMMMVRSFLVIGAYPSFYPYIGPYEYDVVFRGENEGRK